MATKEELMELARELDIPGRSAMSKDELEEAISEYDDEPEADEGPELVTEDDTVRILTRRWNRFIVERDDRPNEGAPDLLDKVTRKGATVEMPRSVAAAFGVHPSFYEA